MEDKVGTARAYAERLEASLAAATHERDLAREKARLAGEGVAGLEQRLERLQEKLERERIEAERELERHATEAERKLGEVEQRSKLELAESEQRSRLELAEAEQRSKLELAEAERRHEGDLSKVKTRLEARERHLENARAGIESRDARLKTTKEQLEVRRKELKKVSGELEAQRTEHAVTRTQLELREEELGRTRATAEQLQRELAEMRERLGEAARDLAARERELAARERDLAARGHELTARERELAARVRELEQAGEELIARERELDLVKERLSDLEREAEEASRLLGAQGAELAKARETARNVERERDQVRRELDQTQTRLATRERHLKTAQLGVESRDRNLASRDAELERLRTAVRNRERNLALAEARLEKAQQRAEHFRGSLVELREGRAYRLMRILWRLRRPFRRAPRGDAEPGGAADDDSEPAAGSTATPTVTAAPRKQEPLRQPGERLRVAAILDEMSEACFAPECELVPLTLERWAEQLDQRHPDLLLVESAWNGNGGEWQYRIAQYRRQDLAGLPALRALLDGCRERGIPTAFWNKEDPVHFERFAEAAALFDHVFTTDARCIERYRGLPGGERTVTALPFAAQPRIHNPAAVVPERSNSPCFAGAWYRDRHPERRRALAALLDAARPRGLVIYDRSFGGDDNAFGFPERFAPHVLGKLPYERILDVYRSHRVFLNANSVVDSPTMCSRRVFELAACDTAILSTPGAALGALLGEGMVAEAADEETAAAALERLLGDEDERRRRTRAARRKVLAEHTYANRLATIAATAGLDPPDGRGDDDWELIVQPGAELSVEAHADLRAASVFADADVIGTHPGNGTPAIEHRKVDSLDPRALLVRRELVESRGPLSDSPEQIHTQLRRWNDEGVRLYAADADLVPSAARRSRSIVAG